MIEKILQVVKENPTFLLTPGREGVRQVVLLPDGKVNDPNNTILSWSVSTDLRTPPNSILLKRESGMFGIFHWSHDCYKGRDYTGSWATLRPNAPTLFDSIYRTNGKSLDTFSLRGIGNSVVTADSITDNRLSPQDYVETIPEDFKKKEAAIVIVGWNRPSYMKKVVDALKANKNVNDYDIISFIDRPKILPELILQEQQAELIKGSFDNVHTIKRGMNFGCGWNITDAKRQAFDAGYERVFVFEDDMIPDSTYLTLCENLLKWGQDNYDNVGLVQGWTKCLLDKKEKKPLAKQVHATYTNLWGYLQTKESWELIKPDLEEYLNVFLTSTYERRPARAILQWLSMKLAEPSIKHDRPFPVDGNSNRHYDNYFRNPPSGQDGVTAALIHKSGQVRLATSVNRGLYIGVEGIHMGVGQFHQDKFDKVTLDNMSDARRKNFEIREEN